MVKNHFTGSGRTVTFTVQDAAEAALAVADAAAADNLAIIITVTSILVLYLCATDVSTSSVPIISDPLPSLTEGRFSGRYSVLPYYIEDNLTVEAAKKLVERLVRIAKRFL